jgi:hypothetical protein
MIDPHRGQEKKKKGENNLENIIGKTLKDPERKREKAISIA